MKTRILQPDNINIMKCAAELRGGRLVAFPTETVYALGAAATNADAVKRVFDVKKRPYNKPLIVAVSKKSKIAEVVESIPPKAQKLIDAFMPGALTLLFDRSSVIPDIVTGGGRSVAVRIPDNEVAKKLIELSGGPVVVPSANTSDKPSPTLAEHVRDDLDGKIEYILDGGASDIGIESTIVDARVDPPIVLRAGGVTVESIERVIGKVSLSRENPKYGGQYIPDAEVLFSAFYEGMAQNICERYDSIVSTGRTAVILCLDGNKAAYGDRNVRTMGKGYAEYAHGLFAALRKADAEHYDAVIAEGVNPEGLGAALVARLVKLSGGMII